MIRFFQRHRGVRGSVTILMLIIMLPMLVFSFTIVDICKIFMAKDVAAEASQLAINAGMTSYDKVLKDMYGILATSKDESELAENMSTYYAATLNAQGIADSGASEDLVIKLLSMIDGVSGFDEKDNDYLNVDPEETNGSFVEVKAYASAAAANPKVLERQIVEYMKYRGPVNMATGMLDKLMALKDIPNQIKVMQDRVEYEKSVGEVSDTAYEIYSLLRLYFSNNLKAEGEPPNESSNPHKTAAKIKEKLPDAEVLKAGGLFTLSKEIDKLQRIFKSASVAVMFYAPVSDLRFRRRSGSGDADDLPDLTEDLDDYDIDDITAAIRTGRSTANRVCQFGADEWNSGLGMEDAVELADAMWKFAGVYTDDVADTELGDAINDFMEAYEDAEDEKEKLDKKLEKMKDKESESYKEANDRSLELAGYLNDARPTYKSIENAMDDFEGVAEYLSSKAESAFGEGKALLRKYLDFTEVQIEIIDDLTGSNSGLDKIIDELNMAKAAAEKHETDLGNVENDSIRNSEKQSFDPEAKEIIELNPADADKIKAILLGQKKYYEKLQEALKSLKVLSEYSTMQPVTIIDQSGDAIKNKLSDYMKFNSGLTIRSDPLRLPDYTWNNQSLGLGKWSDNNKEIPDNPLYKEVEKLAKKLAENETDTTAKDKLMENAKIEGGGDPNDPSMPVNVEEVNDDAADTSDKDREKFKEMANSKLFGAYLKEKAPEEFEPANIDTEDHSEKISTACDTSDQDALIEDTDGMMDGVSSLLGNIAAILEDGRDAILVTEYLTNNFSCHTTSMDESGIRQNNEKMLSGMLFYEEVDGEVKKNVGYTSELEYILYGFDSELANKAAAGGIIFAIRFVLNLIYSFTDSEIRSITQGIATAAAGWIPFGPLIVQTVLHIGLALAESAIDLTMLMTGKSVRLFKSPETWICKPSNLLTQTVEQLIIPTAEGLIEEAVETISKGLNKACDDLSKAISDNLSKMEQWAKGELEEIPSEISGQLHAYVNEQTEVIRSSVENTFYASLREVVQDCVMNKSNSDGDPYTEDEVRSLVADAINGIIESHDPLNSEGEENLINTIITETAKELDIDALARQIHSNIDVFMENTEINVAIDEAETKLDEVMSKLDKKIKDTLSSVKNKINEKLQAGQEKIKQKVTSGIKKSISKFTESANSKTKLTDKEKSKLLKEDINSSISGKPDLTKSGLDLDETKPGKKKSKVGDIVSSLLEMTYKDYMYLFTVIGCIANRDAMLQRAANLISANCVERGGAGENYSLNTAHTFFGITSGASTSTVFYGAVFKDGQLDMSGARKKYEFTQKAYMGY